MDHSPSSPLSADRAAAARAENAAVRATGSSSDGAVSVTVNVHGEIDHVEFAGGADELSLDALGDALLDANRRARARAAREAAAKMDDLLGKDSPTAQTLRARVPVQSVAAFVAAPPPPARLVESIDDQPVVGVASPPPPGPIAPLADRRPVDDEDDEIGGFTRG